LIEPSNNKSVGVVVDPPTMVFTKVLEKSLSKCFQLSFLASTKNNLGYSPCPPAKAEVLAGGAGAGKDLSSTA
jgi:hypothetical protein